MLPHPFNNLPLSVLSPLPTNSTLVGHPPPPSFHPLPFSATRTSFSLPPSLLSSQVRKQERRDGSRSIDRHGEGGICGRLDRWYVFFLSTTSCAMDNTRGEIWIFLWMNFLNTYSCMHHDSAIRSSPYFRTRGAHIQISHSAAGKSLLVGEMLILGRRLKTCGRGYLALEHSPKIEKY